MPQEDVTQLQEYFLLNATNTQNLCLCPLNHFHGCAGSAPPWGVQAENVQLNEKYSCLCRNTAFMVINSPQQLRVSPKALFSCLSLNGWAEFYLQGTQSQKEKVTGSLCPKISLISLQSQSVSKAPQPGKSVLANHRSTEFSCINRKQHRYCYNHGKHHLDFLPHHTSKLSIAGQRF